MKHKFSSMGRVAIALVLALSLFLITAVPAQAIFVSPAVEGATASDLVAGTTDADYNVSFDTNITATATTITVTFPSDYTITEGDLGTAAVQSGVSETSANISVDGADVAVTGVAGVAGAKTITVTIGATDLSSGSGVSFRILTGIKNPTVSGATDTFNITSDAVGEEVTNTAAAVTITPAALAAYTVVPEVGPYVAGAAFDVVITAVDEFLNPVGTAYTTDEPYTWVTSAADAPDKTAPEIGTLSGTDFTNGVATKSVTLYAAESDVTFTILDDGAKTGTSTVITVDPEVLAAYTVVPDGLTQTAGTAFDVVITAVDQFENPLGSDYTDPGAAYTWETNASDPSDIDTLAYGDFGVVGFATMSVTLNVIETGVTFTVTDSNTITGNSVGAEVEVVAGLAARLKVTGDATMTAGGTNELTITAYDAADNVATSYTGSKTLIFSGLVVAPDATAPTVEGVTMENETTVTFTLGVSSGTNATLIAYKAETKQVEVSDGTIDSTGDAAYDLDLTVDPAAAAQLAYTVEPASPTAGVETTKFTVQRQDQYANPVTSGETVVGLASDSTGTAKEFRATASGAAVTEVTVPDTESTADFYYYDEKAGDWTITASVAGLTSGESALTVGPATIDHYDVSPIASPQVIGAAFEVIIQAQDIFNNDITAGPEEDVNITVTAGGTVAPSTTGVTVAGAAAVDVSLSEITLGQTIAFAGATSGKTGASNPFRVVTVGVIDHYVVTVDAEPKVVGSAFGVTIQAKDAAGNDITVGDDIAEAITITFGLPDAGAMPTSDTTSAGTVTVSMTMTVAQAGQTIIVTGDVSGKSGTSNSFTVYDKILTLSEGWTLISTPLWISTDSAWINAPALVYKAAGSVFSTDVILAEDLQPVEALYVKMGSEGGSIGLIYSTDAQGVSAKELVAGWNLISSANSDVDNAQAVLAELQDVGSLGVGLTTVVNQHAYNQNSLADFYVDAGTWDNLELIDLKAFDGYWIRMNADKTFAVVPQP